ncbi:MAG: hypothetical protein IJJ14_06330 [Coriobacteriales bacterium]|nr:hypothetical protein [Coriobacteriales bacterium]
MLFVLSGNIQSGKSRWLERTAARLEGEGVVICGVLAPGVWVDCGPGRSRDTGAGGGGDWDKRGIYNVLLPGWERLVFARRNDEYISDSGYGGTPGAWMPKPGDEAKPGLWGFDDSVMDRVNRHFDMLAGWAAGGIHPDADAPHLLVADEFGQFELFMGRGLTSAVAMIDHGATELFPHALVVVRSELLDAGLKRLSPAAEGWGGLTIIGADEDSFKLLEEYNGLTE